MENLNLIRYDNLNEHSEKIAHFSSTKSGGVSTGAYESLNLGLFTNDKAENIAKNRSLLCTELGIAESNLLNAHQTHGKAVKHIDKSFLALNTAERQDALKSYDALITNLPNTCVTATTADCVPILFYDKENQAVAAIHSGWRSTLENICAETLDQMQLAFGSRPQQIIAAIGPCISKDKYEVGEDVYQAFADKGFNCSHTFTATANGKYLFDIREAVRLQLIILGISNIECSTFCTYSEEDLFFSARRMGTDSGRMLSGIFLKQQPPNPLKGALV